MNKPRSDSRLFKLTEDQQAQLYDWIITIGYAKARERLASDPPDGFGVKAHLNSLHAFYIRYSAERQNENFAEAEDVERPEPSKIFSLAEKAVHAGAFQLSTSPIDTESFRELSRWVCNQQSNAARRELVRLSEQSLALRQKRHAFEREKFELSVAQLALQHAAALQRINYNLADTQARIRAAREQLYGPRINVDHPDSPGPANDQTGGTSHV